MAEQKVPKTATARPRPSERIRGAGSLDLRLPMIGHVRIPRASHVAFYGGLAGLAALQILEWPMTLMLVAAHALTEQEHSRLVANFGDALQEA